MCALDEALRCHGNISNVYFCVRHRHIIASHEVEY